MKISRTDLTTRLATLALGVFGLTGCVLQNSFPTATYQYPAHGPGTSATEPSTSSWCVSTSGAVTRKNTEQCLLDGGQSFESLSAAKQYSAKAAAIETAPIEDKTPEEKALAAAVANAIKPQTRPARKPLQRITCSSSDWSHFSSEDEMTGDLRGFATGKRTRPTKQMQFPYHAVSAWMGFGCEGQREWAFIGFSESPNLSRDRTRSGYNEVETRVRWDDEVETLNLTQEWGSRFLNFVDDPEAIDKMISSGNVLLELQWFGSGSVYFPFSLKCSTNAIIDARELCTRE